MGRGGWATGSRLHQLTSSVVLSPRRGAEHRAWLSCLLHAIDRGMFDRNCTSLCHAVTQDAAGQANRRAEVPASMVDHFDCWIADAEPGKQHGGWDGQAERATVWLIAGGGARSRQCIGRLQICSKIVLSFLLAELAECNQLGFG